MQRDKHFRTTRARLPRISARARSQRQQKYGSRWGKRDRSVELMEAPHAIWPTGLPAWLRAFDSGHAASAASPPEHFGSKQHRYTHDAASLLPEECSMPSRTLHSISGRVRYSTNDTRSSLQSLLFASGGDAIVKTDHVLFLHEHQLWRTRIRLTS